MKKLTILCTALLGVASLTPALAGQPFTVLETSAAPVVREIPLAPGDTLLAQAPNQSNGVFSDVGCDICGPGEQVVADDFVLGAEDIIGQFMFWGGYFPLDVAPAQSLFRVIIHQDAAGPGAVVYDESGIAPTSRTDTGLVLFGVTEYEFVLDLPNAPTLPAGTYWVELFTDTGLGTDDFFWEVGDLDGVNGVSGSVFAFEAPGATWNLSADDFALVIIAGAPPAIPIIEVPTLAPWGIGALVLLLTGLSMAILRRRKA